MERQIAVNPNVGIQEYTIKPGDGPIRIARNLGWNNEQSVVQAIRDTYGDYTSTYEQLMRKYMHPGVKINIGEAFGELPATTVVAEMPQHLKVAAGDAIRSGAVKITDFPVESRAAIMEGVGAPSQEAAAAVAPLVIGAMNPVGYIMGETGRRFIAAGTQALRGGDDYRAIDFLAPQGMVSVSSPEFVQEHPYLAIGLDALSGVAGGRALQGLMNVGLQGGPIQVARGPVSSRSYWHTFRPGNVPQEYADYVVGKPAKTAYVPTKGGSAGGSTAKSQMGGNGQTTHTQGTVRTGGNPKGHGGAKRINPRGKMYQKDVSVYIPGEEAPGVPPYIETYPYSVVLPLKKKNYVEPPYSPTVADRESVRTQESPWMRTGTYVQGPYKPAEGKTYTATYDTEAYDNGGNPSYVATEVVEPVVKVPSDRYVMKMSGEHGKWRTTPGNNTLLIIK